MESKDWLMDDKKIEKVILNALKSAKGNERLAKAMTSDLIEKLQRYKKDGRSVYTDLVGCSSKPTKKGS